ncbi:hypothetical protein ACH41E_23005 [Streptomyces sp. NPDC020412]|uniref:hypothetical protein n=1 Tax=Streptomyces sp. NPDC020412 TaxID=3365073 RepID=UPI0037AC08E5
MTQCRASFERAAEFVFAAAHAPDASVNHQLQALFGTSLAEKAGDPLAAVRVGEMAGELRGRLDHAYDAGGFDPFTHDAKLLLLALPVLLLQKLSEYDLILGTALLRTLAYLDVPDPEAVDWATRYLESQQQSDGRFGYYARELAEGPELRTVDQNLLCL